jgi:hypothetical protein
MLRIYREYGRGNRASVLAVTFAVIALLGPSGALPAQATLSLEACQRLQAKIERYESLRRAGGSHEQMQAWKRSRNAARQAFIDGGCRRFRYELR